MAWPRLMDAKTAAAYSGVAASTIRDWIADDLLMPIKVPGSRLRIRGEDGQSRRDGNGKVRRIKSSARAMRKDELKQRKKFVAPLGNPYAVPKPCDGGADPASRKGCPVGTEEGRE